MDPTWTIVQISGYSENGQSIYGQIPFNPYFTVKYNPEVSPDSIDEYHNYLISETPIEKITSLPGDKYRIYTRNKDHYYASLAFYTPNSPGKILDEDQSLLSKFLSARNITPGVWQVASNISPLKAKISVADLELAIPQITSSESDLPIPQGVLAFFDIEAISGDNISFPDPEAFQPADKIFAISLIVSQPGYPLSINSYIITDEILPSPHTLPRGQTANIITVETEKDLLELFFRQLGKFRPDRLVSMNGRHFDINYIGVRSKILGVDIYPFTKLLSYQPNFQEVQLVQTVPFPLTSSVESMTTPGISQIDLLDVYRRLHPLLGNHRLETLGQIILGQGKTGLSVSDMFSKYRRGSVSDLLEIIEYSVVDSILLYDLWQKSKLDKVLAYYANFWRQDTDQVITTDLPLLFNDLMRYYTANLPVDFPTKYKVGRPIITDRVPGIHWGVKLYSLNGVYAKFIRQSNSPVAGIIADYFSDDDAVIAFRSGYFPVHFSAISRFIERKVPSDYRIWIDETTIAVKSDYPMDPIFKLTDIIDIIVAQKSWIVINNIGIIFRKGMSHLVRPPFPLLARYIDYLIARVKDGPQKSIKLPALVTTLQDLEREVKVAGKDFSAPSSRLAPLITQLKEEGIKAPSTWLKVKYISTKEGPIIKQVYNQDPQKYEKLLDKKYYRQIVTNTMSSISPNIKIDLPDIIR